MSDPTYAREVWVIEYESMPVGCSLRELNPIGPYKGVKYFPAELSQEEKAKIWDEGYKAWAGSSNPYRETEGSNA